MSKRELTFKEKNQAIDRAIAALEEKYKKPAKKGEVIIDQFKFKHSRRYRGEVAAEQARRKKENEGIDGNKEDLSTDTIDNGRPGANREGTD